MDTTTTVASDSYVRVNRLKDSWTWSVQVSAAGPEIDDLERAKTAALSIAYDLRDELAPNATKVEQAEKEDVPF